MIKAADVRLGNVVYATDNTRKNVTIEVIEYLHRYEGINQATGVYISPRILSQYGFELKREDTDFYKNTILTYKLRAIKLFFRSGKLESVSCGCDTNLKHIQYLHQLQNLYYAWYGKELEEIKEPDVQVSDTTKLNY